jgi:hypothetical protein
MEPLRTLTVPARKCSTRPDGTPMFKMWISNNHLEVNTDLITNVKNVLDILFTHIYYPYGTPTVHSKRTKQRLVNMIAPHIIYAQKEDTSRWSEVKKPLKEFTLPAGTYYIGDLCYAMPDEIYHDIWDDKFNFNDGCYKRAAAGPEDMDVYFAMRGTGGDGEMIGSDGKRFMIDAGHIGIASVSICTKADKPDTIYTFTKDVQCSLLGDSFKFSDGQQYLSIKWKNYDEENY